MEEERGPLANELTETGRGGGMVDNMEGDDEVDMQQQDNRGRITDGGDEREVEDRIEELGAL